MSKLFRPFRLQEILRDTLHGPPLAMLAVFLDWSDGTVCRSCAVPDFDELVARALVPVNNQVACLPINGPFEKSAIVDPECGINVRTNDVKMRRRVLVCVNVNLQAVYPLDKDTSLHKQPFSVRLLPNAAS